MSEFGVNFVRLPLGYWNVVDMKKKPNGPDKEQRERMGNLAKMMPAAKYRPYIENVMRWAEKYGLQVLLDLHGAPGSQNPSSHNGCNTGGVYWDTKWNKKWTKKAIVALAEICKEFENSCYGVELLNEPHWDI